MGTGLKLQPGVGAAALHRGHHFLHAAQLRQVLADHGQGKALSLGVHGVHPQQVGSEQGTLLPANASPDLQDHVLLIVGILGQQQTLQFLLHPLRLRFCRGKFLLGQFTQLRVGQHLLGVGLILLCLAVGPECRHDGGQFLLFPAQTGQLFPVTVHRRIGQLALDLRQALLDFCQFFLHTGSPYCSR